MEINQIKKILFMNYLEGIPEPNVGGPNHVVYDFISNYRSKEFTFDFMSYGAFISELESSYQYTSKEMYVGIKKYTNGLYYRNAYFRFLVSNSFYKPFHFLKHNRYFNKQMPIDNYSIIHAHDPISLSFCSKKPKAKKLMTIHHHIPYSMDLSLSVQNKFIQNKVCKSLRRREVESINLSDIITFPSKSVKSYFFDELGEFPDKDVRVIYNGVDIDKINSISHGSLKNIGFDTNGQYDIIFLSVASHEKYKNLELVLKTIGYLKSHFKKNILFVNCGEGSLTKELIKLSVNLGIADNVKFLGNVPNETVLQLMKVSDIFLHLPERVVFDLSILEALACGTCVIASNRGGNSEVIINGFNGYLVDELAPEIISNLIVSANRNRTKENAIDSIKSYSIENYVRQYTKLYEELS